jgi:hypothetical protein
MLFVRLFFHGQLVRVSEDVENLVEDKEKGFLSPIFKKAYIIRLILFTLNHKIHFLPSIYMIQVLQKKKYIRF